MSSPAPHRRRTRWVTAALLALPAAELALIIIVGRGIGVLATLLLLSAGAVGGVIVLRRAGAAATRRFAEAQTTDPAGQDPPVGTALLVPAGLLLIVPGFLSDVAALVLLVPAVRRSLSARMGEAVLRRVNLRADLRAVRVVPGEVVDVRVTDIRTGRPTGGPPALPPPATMDPPP